MNQAVKTVWLSALRNGSYTKGKGYLQRDNAFCCLGVLCDLHAKATGGHWSDEMIGRNEYLDEPHYLPMIVVEWAELPDQNPMIAGHLLSQHNDGHQTAELNLDEIANLIERYL